MTLEGSSFSAFQDWAWQTKGIRPENLTDLSPDEYRSFWGEYLSWKIEVEANQPPKPKKLKKPASEANNWGFTPKLKRNRREGKFEDKEQSL